MKSMYYIFCILFYALVLPLVLYDGGGSVILGYKLPISKSSSGDVKCLQRERQALLSFQQGLLHDWGVLSTWRENQSNGDCCNWEGIHCNNETGNKLSGEIPSEIGNLTSLEFLDLSRNSLSGQIPSTLSQIDGIGVLNLSHNSLSGRIPLGRHMQTFEASSFEGNPDLCGEQLNKSCPGDNNTSLSPQGLPTHDDEEDDNSAFYEALYMSLGLGFFAGFWAFFGPILIWRSWRIAYLRVLNKLADDIYVMVALNMAKCRRLLKN